MKSKNPSETWNSLASIDYASSDFGIEDIATSYASEIASLRTANTEPKSSIHDKFVQVNEVEQDPESDSLVSDASSMNSANFTSEKALYQSENKQVVDSSRCQASLVSKDKDELSLTPTAIHTDNSQAIVAQNEPNLDLFGMLRTRLDITGESVKLRSNEIFVSTSTNSVSQNTLDSTSATATSAKDSSFQVDLSTPTTDDVDVEWGEFVQLQEFANQVMSKQEVTPLPKSNNDTLLLNNTQGEAKTESQATLVESQQVREDSQELFAAARNLLKRLHKN